MCILGCNLKCIFYFRSHFKKLANYFRAQRAGRGWGHGAGDTGLCGDAGRSRALVMGTER